jgi:hypothetical protein
LKRARRSVPTAASIAALAVLATSAHASATGWSTPHTVKAYTAGTFAAGPNGQAVQLFGTGGAPTRTAQLRAIKSDATQGTAVGVNAGAPGFDFPEVSVNANGRLVAAWTLDTQGPGPIGLAGTLGSRSSLPRTASVLATDGQSVSDVATAIGANGNGVVAWIQAPLSGGATTVKAATLRSGQAPQVVTINTRADATLGNLSLGIDGSGRPVVSWSVNPTGGNALLIAIARGDGTGAYAAANEVQIGNAPFTTMQNFVLGNGDLLVLWVEGTPSSGVHVWTTTESPGGGFVGRSALTDGRPGRGQVRFAANASGRAALLFPLATSGGTTLKVQLRSASSGNWGTPRVLGQSGRYVNNTNIGVDAKGRVVALWDDGSSSSKAATRVLAARSSSSTDPLGSYNQVSQRSGDKRCKAPSLFLSTSGDGLGLWQCSTSSSGTSFAPRLARLTKPS